MTLTWGDIAEVELADLVALLIAYLLHLFFRKKSTPPAQR
jgi:hypothetical protein